MLKKKSYYIRINRKESFIKNEDKVISFSFNEEEEKPALKYEGHISNLNSFEEQLDHQLTKLNFNIKPWISNTIYLTTINEDNNVQMRSYFDVAYLLGAKKCYIMRENIALLYHQEYSNLKDQLICFLGIYKTKIEISLIKNYKFEYLETVYPSRENDYKIDDLTSFVQDKTSALQTNHTIDKYFIIGNEITRYDDLPKLFTPIQNSDKLILEGIEVAAKLKSEYFYMR